MVYRGLRQGAGQLSWGVAGQGGGRVLRLVARTILCTGEQIEACATSFLLSSVCENKDGVLWGRMGCSWWNAAVEVR